MCNGSGAGGLIENILSCMYRTVFSGVFECVCVCVCMRPCWCKGMCDYTLGLNCDCKPQVYNMLFINTHLHFNIH